MAALFGIRRVIERPGRASYVRTQELLCPCCGRPTRVEWEQDTGRGCTATETHCENRDCAGYKMTTRIDVFYERYGQSTLQFKE